MPDWGMWIIGISIAVVAAAIVVLVIFLALALQSLRRTLHHTNKLLDDTTEIIEDVDEKLEALNPYFRVAGGLGGHLERFTCAKCERVEQRTSVPVDAVDWVIAGLDIWQKIRQRWR